MLYLECLGREGRLADRMARRRATGLRPTTKSDAVPSPQAGQAGRTISHPSKQKKGRIHWRRRVPSPRTFPRRL